MDVDKDDDEEAVDVLELDGWSSFFSSSFFFSSFLRLLFLVRLTLVSSSKKGRLKFKASDASNDETINPAPSAMTNDSLFARNFKTIFSLTSESVPCVNLFRFLSLKNKVGGESFDPPPNNLDIYFETQVFFSVSIPFCISALYASVASGLSRCCSNPAIVASM